jgi:hypothetical protein
MILGFAFLCTLILCIVKPKYGVYSIFVFSILLSNALQWTFIKTVRGFSTPFSFIGLSGLEVVDKQGGRILIVILLISTVFRKIYNNQQINGLWIIKAVFSIIVISIISMYFNDIKLRDGLSSISLLIVSMLFLAAVMDIQFSSNDIKLFLKYALLFVILNAIFQIYQFFNFANGDVDMTVGLLMDTTPTSLFAFVVSFFFMSKIISGAFNKEVLTAIILSTIQLVSSYLKAIIVYFIVIMISFRQFFFRGWKFILIALTTLFLLISISFFIFKSAVTDYTVFYIFDNTELLLKLGPVQVWTEYFQFLKSPIDLLFGYGPSSYGSLNSVDEAGNRTSKLAGMVQLYDSGLGDRSLFMTALSSLGNIIWENGIIVLFLFVYFHYKIFKESSMIYSQTQNNDLKVYAFAVKYEVIFIILLYLVAFGNTTEEILLWGVPFVVYSFIKSEFQLEPPLESSK